MRLPSFSCADLGEGGRTSVLNFLQTSLVSALLLG